MSDANKDLELIVRLKDQPPQVAATLESIDKLKSGQQELDAAQKKFNNRNDRDAVLLSIKARIQATKDLAEQMRRQDVLAAQQALFDKLQQEEAQTKRNTFSFQGLRSAISQMGNQLLGIPGLGRSISSVLGASIVLLIGLYVKAKHALAEWNDEMDRQMETLSRPDFMGIIKARIAAMDEGAVSAAQFADKMAHLRDPEAVFQKQLSDDIDLLRARNEAMKEVADATFGLDKDKLKEGSEFADSELTRQLQNGKINLAQYNALKLALDADYFAKLTQLEIAHEQQKMEREKGLRDAELAIDEAGLGRARTRQPGLMTAAVAARGASTAAATQAAVDEARLDESSRLKVNKEKEASDLEKEIDKKYGKPGLAPFSRIAGTGIGELRDLIAGGADITGSGADLLNRYDAATGSAGIASADINKLRRRLPGEKAGASVAGAAATRAEASAATNQDRITDKEEANRIQRDKNGLLENAGKATAQAEGLQKLIEYRAAHAGDHIGGGFNVGDEGRFEQIRDLKASGGHLTQEQQQFLTTFSLFINQQLGWHNKVGPLLLTAVDSTKAVDARVDAIKKIMDDELARLKRKVYGAYNP